MKLRLIVGLIIVTITTISGVRAEITDVSLLAYEADANNMRASCSDMYALKVLEIWLDAIPSESRVMIADPDIRRAAEGLDPIYLRIAAARIFSTADSRQENSDEFGLESQSISADDLRYGMANGYEGNPAYSPQMIVRSPLRGISAVKVKERKPLSRCAEIFRAFAIGVDERVGQLVVSHRSFFSKVDFTYSFAPGTPMINPDFLSPAGGCVRRPIGDEDFYKIKDDGRMAGNYSPLGFPEAVAISFVSAKPAKGEWTCSGVLVGDKWALTAAHCINNGTNVSDNTQTVVLLNNATATRREREGKPISSRLVGQPRIPVEYLDALKAGKGDVDRGPVDLALLELTHPLGPSAVNLFEGPIPNKIQGTLAGYGAIGGPKKKPAAVGTKPPLDVGWLKLNVTEAMIKWKATTSQGVSSAAVNSSCPGDSGAPIYISVDKQGAAVDLPAFGCIFETRRLLGLVSYGSTNSNKAFCLASSEGAGPKLSKHRSWLCKEANLFCEPVDVTSSNNLTR